VEGARSARAIDKGEGGDGQRRRAAGQTSSPCAVSRSLFLTVRVQVRQVQDRTHKTSRTRKVSDAVLTIAPSETSRSIHDALRSHNKSTDRRPS
jgi:hypothetical protein